MLVCKRAVTLRGLREKGLFSSKTQLSLLCDFYSEREPKVQTLETPRGSEHRLCFLVNPGSAADCCPSCFVVRNPLCTENGLVTCRWKRPALSCQSRFVRCRTQTRLCFVIIAFCSVLK